MKTYLSILLALLVSAVAFANKNYEKAMREALDHLEAASSVAELLPVSNQFDRIADVKKEDWLPQYHAAYTRVMMAAMEVDNDKKDVYLDAAQLNLDAVEKLEHDASERMALQGFLHMIRMSVDQNRGMELGMKCGSIIQQAYEHNNDNPRAVLMLGQFQFGSAQFMGQDTSEACGLFDETLRLLDQLENETQGAFYPSWGRLIAVHGKQQCATNVQNQGK